MFKEIYYLAFIIVRSWKYLNQYERLTGDIQNNNLWHYKKWRFDE